MLPKYLFYISFGALLLTGCGLDTDDEDDTEESGTTTVTVDVEQSPYLPLTNATRFSYTEADSGTPGGVDALITYDVGTSNSKGYSVYKVAMSGDLELDLYFRTTDNQIRLLGLDGPVAVTDNTTVDNLRFTSPISLIGDRSSTSVTATADIDANGTEVNGADISIEYTITNSTAETFSHADWSTLSLPTLRSTFTGSFTASSTLGTIGPLPITLTFYFTEGLGLVQYSGDFTSAAGNEQEIEFYDLQDLPNIVAFDQSGNNVEGTSSVFTLAGAASDSNISSTQYRIVNQSELDALGWLEIEASVTNIYEASIDTSATLPSDLTSVQVLFENRNTEGDRLSANLTLLAP